MNHNFHQSLEDKCHRFLNAVEPETMVEIHRDQRRMSRSLSCEARLE